MKESLIQTPFDALCYYAECAVASYEIAIDTKKYGKFDRSRLRRIAQGMCDNLARFRNTADERFEAEMVICRMERALKGDSDVAATGTPEV